MVGQQMQRYPYSYSSPPEKLSVNTEKHSYYHSYCAPHQHQQDSPSSYTYRMQRTRSKGPHRQRMDDPIVAPHENDVLMGRGGKNNAHSGNESLREMARVEAENYRSSTKKGKSEISRWLVLQMRQLNPSARFLKRDNNNGAWEEVGEDTAREKASQVLRDAVNALPPETASEASTEEDGTAEEPIETPSSDANDRSRSIRQARLDDTDPLPILPTVPSALPPPTPVRVTSRKRRRGRSLPEPGRHGYNSYATSSDMPMASPVVSQDAYSPNAAMSPVHPNHDGYYYPNQHAHLASQHFLPPGSDQYSYSQPRELRPRRPDHIRNRDTSGASAQSLLGDVRDHPSGEADFDLFQGELLASDDESQSGQHSSRGHGASSRSPAFQRPRHR